MRRKTDGFTMIELLFAMSFVSVLLILILTATLQITRIYNKGISLKQVNQSGLLVGADMRATIKGANAPLDTSRVADGRLCLGTYSYVWNIGDSTGNRYAGADSGTRIGLVKVSDNARQLCTGNTAVNKAAARELLVAANGDTQGVSLRVRSLSVSDAAQAGINYAYTVSYTLSTDDNTLIRDDSSACKGGASDEFCALNSFTFTTYARQGGNGSAN